MLHEIDLRTLAEHVGHDRAYVSLYLENSDARGSLRNREDKVRALLSDEGDELTQFEENMERLDAWLEEAEIRGRSCCVFTSWAESWIQGYTLDVELTTQLRVGPAPYIRPLAELQEELSKFVTVVADNTATRIWVVHSAQAELEERIKGDVKNRVKKGGWSQQRYARRREKELRGYANEVGDVLDRLVREEGFERIVLLGSQETLGEIESVLSQAAAGKVVGRKGVDVHEGDDALLEHALELFTEEERASEKLGWKEIKDEYLSDGLAVVGAEDVLRAALIGQVDSVVVARDAKLRATRCRDCENVFADDHSACKACGSGSVFPVDLVDSLARHLELTGASIDFVDPLPGLEKVGQVAAHLRY